MGVVYVDSFDFYPTADISLKWPHSYLSQITIASAAARTGNSGLEFTTNSSGLYGYISTPQIMTSTEVIVGFAFYIVTMPTSQTQYNVILQFWDNTSYATRGISIVLDNSGHLLFANTAGVTGNNWSGTALTTGTWYYVEVKCKYSSGTAAGDVEIRVDYGSGPTVVNDISAGITTRGGANSGFGGIQLGSAYGNNTTFGNSVTCFYIDDLYVIDATTGVNTTYLGNCTVNCLMPKGAGVSSQFTPNQTGHANYTEVDEASFDGDTTYVSTSGVGNRDTYTIQSLPNTPKEIFAVHMSSFDRIDASETTRTMNNSLYINSTYYDGTVSGDLTSTYQAIRTVWENNPATSTQFQVSDISSMEAGVKLVS